MRPLYYEWSQHEEAYEYAAKGYQFGDALIVYPIVEGRSEKTGMTPVQKMWLPPGRWWDAVLGGVLEGPLTVANQYLLQEVPMFQDVNVAVPLMDRGTDVMGGAAAERFERLVWQMVVAPAAEGSSSEDGGCGQEQDEKRGAVQKVFGWAFEDDGHSPRVRDFSALTFGAEVAEVRARAEKSGCGGGNNSRGSLRLSVTLGERVFGERKRFGNRKYTVQLQNFAGTVRQVWAEPDDGKTREKKVRSWYCRRANSVFLDFSAVDDWAWHEEKTFHFELTPVVDTADNFLLGAVRRARLASNLLSEANVNYGVKDRGDLIDAANALAKIEYAVEAGGAEKSGDFWESLKKGRDEVAQVQGVSDARRVKALALIDEALRYGSAGRGDMSVGAKEADAGVETMLYV